MAEEKTSQDATASVSAENDFVDSTTSRPQGWKYNERRVGGLKLTWYASPSFQLVMVAFVCFLCPGMFNALGGLGGGGKADHTLADQMVSFGLVSKHDDLII
jgi:hypothetical protein